MKIIVSEKFAKKEKPSEYKNIQNIRIASQKVFVGNCITGLNDPMFQDYIAEDATELAQIVGSGIEITKEDFLNMVLLDPTILDILNKDKNRYQYYYNQGKDIAWYYDTIKDIEYFYG